MYRFVSSELCEYPGTIQEVGDQRSSALQERGSSCFVWWIESIADGAGEEIIDRVY